MRVFVKSGEEIWIALPARCGLVVCPCTVLSCAPPLSDGTVVVKFRPVAGPALEEDVDAPLRLDMRIDDDCSVNVPPSNLRRWNWGYRRPYRGAAAAAAVNFHASIDDDGAAHALVSLSR